jgi:ABC-type glycerol-3-phosphate transport system substrate-binding protein
MSPKKIAFFALVAVVIVALGIGFTLLAGKSGKTSGPKGPKELTVWVVGDDTVGFDPLIAEFKKKDTYKDTNVIFSKFANYQDYERALINVIADGNSPDIFVIPSTGSEMLANKIQPISDSFFYASDASKNMNRLFDSNRGNLQRGKIFK